MGVTGMHGRASTICISQNLGQPCVAYGSRFSEVIAKFNGALTNRIHLEQLGILRKWNHITRLVRSLSWRPAW